MISATGRSGQGRKPVSGWVFGSHAVSVVDAVVERPWSEPTGDPKMFARQARRKEK
jgi:hypothetical protein